MEKLLDIMGYSKKLDEKIKFTYILNGIGLSQLILFMFFYVLVAKSILLFTESVVVLIAYLIAFYLLKKKRYLSGKSLPMMAMTLQVALLVFVWFPAETYFVFYFFLIPPMSFFVLDIHEPSDRKMLVFLNSLTVVLLMLSSVVSPLELITLNEKYILLLRMMSVASTVGVEILFFYFYASSLAKTYSELKMLANTDALTNMANRRALFEQGAMLVSIHAKYGKAFTLMILDIDHFKLVNDQYGHPAGDEVLKEMSRIISENIRKGDLVCRYGGEEFAVLYKNMDQDHRQSIENIKKKINAHRFSIAEGVHVSLTFSAGVITYNANVGSFDELVRKADALLYEAKESGRNRIIFDENPKPAQA